jgi:hypothetical protein
MTAHSPAQLRIGDIGVALRCDESAMTFAVSGAAQRFLAGGNAADATVTASWGDLSRPAPSDEIFDSSGLWKLYGEDGDYVFRFTAPAYGEHPYKQARFSPDFTRGEVTLHADYFDRGQPAFPLEYPLDELLLTNLLARGRGVEVHALGIRDGDGRGYLFLGHSGAGKSTMARLWEGTGVLVLSDDRIILRMRDGKVWMYGTPWHGEEELAAAERTLLTRSFVLGRGAANELVALAPPRAVSELFTRSFVPFYNAAALRYTLEVLQQVADAVACAELRFVPDREVVEFVRECAS